MKKWLWILFFLLVAVIALLFPYNWLLHGQKILFHCINISADRSLSYGELGDFIGGVFGGFIGTIIAGIACILVYLTYKNQSDTADKQQFETIFFNLLNNHKGCLNSIHYTKPLLTYPFCDTVSNIEKRKELLQKQSKGELSEDDYKNHFTEQQLCGEAALREYYDDVILPELKKNSTDRLCDIYYHSWFASIKFIINYIDKTKTIIDKEFYFEYLFSQITKSELWFLYSIYQMQEEMDSDKKAIKSFADMIKRRKLFDYGYTFLKEKYSIQNREKIYDKIKF
ncbi:MAG: hypothetical protein J5651_05460 [Salinivirgaceae bacterium]|nr:hypothetical protein [Salinivirgaceae bacterium]